MTILLNKSEKSEAFDEDNTQTKVSTMREKLLVEFKKIDNDSKAVVAADILIFCIHVSFRYGWNSRVIVGFLTILSICPNAARIRDGNGYLPIHLICDHKSDRSLFFNLLLCTYLRLNRYIVKNYPDMQIWLYSTLCYLLIPMGH